MLADKRGGSGTCRKYCRKSFMTKVMGDEVVETLCNEISLFLDIRFVSHIIPCSTVPCIGDAVSRSFPENVLEVCISRNCPKRKSLSQKKMPVSTFDSSCFYTQSSLAPVHGHEVWLLSLVKFTRKSSSSVNISNNTACNILSELAKNHGNAQKCLHALAASVSNPAHGYLPRNGSPISQIKAWRGHAEGSGHSVRSSLPSTL